MLGGAASGPPAGPEPEVPAGRAREVLEQVVWAFVGAGVWVLAAGAGVRQRRLSRVVRRVSWAGSLGFGRRPARVLWGPGRLAAPGRGACSGPRPAPRALGPGRTRPSPTPGFSGRKWRRG